MSPARVSGESAWRRTRIVVPVTSPAAGADWTRAVDAGHVYELLAVSATLTTSAVAANRLARLVLGDGNAIFADVPASVVQTAALAWRYTWARGLTQYQVGLFATAPLPELALSEGMTLASTTTAIDAGDAWTAIRLFVTDTWVQGAGTDIDLVPDLRVEVLTGPLG